MKSLITEIDFVLFSSIHEFGLSQKFMKNIFVFVSVAATATTVGMLIASTPASAAQLYNFSYSGTDINAEGTFTTDGPGKEPGSFLITGITGQRNGVAITQLLPPGTYPVGPDVTPNDNLFFPNQDIKLTFPGFSFQTADNKQYNAYYDTDKSSYLECSTPRCDNDPQITFTATPVPEPASVLGLLAFSVLGANSVLKKKKASV